MADSKCSPDDLHVMFLLFKGPGHLSPMVDIAKLLVSAAAGVKVTVVATPADAPLIKPSIDCFNRRMKGGDLISLLTLRLPTFNGMAADRPDPTQSDRWEFIAAINSLETPFEQVVREERPDCIIADALYPWCNDVASRFGIPRISFDVSSFFTAVASRIVFESKPYESVDGDEEPFDIPGMPHPIRMAKSQLPDFSGAFASNNDGDNNCWIEHIGKMRASAYSCFGTVRNSFYELEAEYIDMLKGMAPNKVWHVGPVSLCNRDDIDRAVRGNDSGIDSEERCLMMRWLENKQPASVLYVCFGSLGRFTNAQLREMAEGLAASGRPFIWVVKDGENNNDNSESELMKAVDELMGEGQEAAERRRRAKKVAEMGRAAVDDGSSSHKEILRLIQDLREAKLLSTAASST